MARAYREAVGCGVDPEQFWRLTPWQTRIAAFGGHEYRATLAWLTAALGRSGKRMPELAKVVGGTTPKKSPEALAALIMQLGKAAQNG